jgi:hypothetical protein
MKPATAQKGKSVCRIPEPELTLARHVDSADPRLAELVRLLARRAARSWYENMVEEHRLKRS